MGARLVTAFIFTTKGFEVGYSGDGFYAYGETTKHKFDYDEDSRGPYPDFSGQTLHWSIDLAGKDQWDEMLGWTDKPTSPERMIMLTDFFARCGKPVGLAWKWDESAVTLRYSFPEDRGLVSFIMAAVVADRELVFRCPGFQFVDDDTIAPAASATGFLERKEPAFLIELPRIGLK